MITGVAFCPQAPALVPEVGRGLDAELGEVREACRTAIRRVAAAGDAVVVVGSAPATARFGATSRGSLRPWGVDLDVPLGSSDPGPIDLPPSLTVGAWLVRDALGPDTGATGRAVADDLPELRLPDVPVALVVVGDGSASHTEKAPGHLHPGAAGYDRLVADALRSGDGSALHQHPDDPRLLVAGWPAWTTVSYELEGSTWTPDLLYADAPFGVGYFVASWTRA